MVALIKYVDGSIEDISVDNLAQALDEFIKRVSTYRDDNSRRPIRVSTKDSPPYHSEVQLLAEFNVYH